MIENHLTNTDSKLEKNDIHYGTVITWDTNRGFGQIQDIYSGAKWWCHYSNIIMKGFKKLCVGDEVRFVIGVGPTGRLQAENVVVI